MTKTTSAADKGSKKNEKSDQKGRSDALISAVIHHWSASPDDALSVRSLTSSIGTAASAIDYYFGGLEQLYVSASLRALADAKVWMESVICDLVCLGDQPMSAGLRSFVIASLIDRWIGERPLAMAWRRTKSFPAKGEAVAARLAWDEAWTRLWTQLAELLGLGKHEDTLVAFADGEACRHLLEWKPILDASLLQETAQALVAWLDAGQVAGDGCRLAYRSGVTASFADMFRNGARSETSFSDAAANLLAREGRSGVTFRAVAKEANSTLGVVSHHFGSKSNLLREALCRLYEREAMTGDREAQFKQEIAPSIMLDEIVAAIAIGTHPVLYAYDEIELAIYNDPEFIDLRAAVRCMDDPSGTWAVKNLLGGQQPSQALVAAISSVCRGAGHLIATGVRPADNSNALIRSALTPFCVN